MEDLDRIQNIFKTLADTNRLKILEGLSLACRSVNEISEVVGLSQPLTSHHLKMLRTAGIVRVEIRATSRYYCLADETIGEIVRLCKAFVAQSKKGNGFEESDMEANVNSKGD